MKKYTEEYIETVLQQPMNNFLNGGDAISLFLEVSNIDEKLVPLALYYATLCDFTQKINELDINLETIAGFAEGFKQDLERNKDKIEELAKVATFNQPKMDDVFKQMMM